ncbi:MAG: DUF342 domain-containing protein, partial [Desulfobacteraceae bacterium]|nr:DUF342 domain-containing protein [Desulfobacteraceae bacterium]
MTEPPKPKILILEGDETIRDHARNILAKEGWEVHCETVSKQALLRLKGSKSSPFNLFISSFKLPKMEGDDILKNAKAISPMTQRMLMVPANKPDLVIRAINKGGINSCIIYPFQDEDLVNQAKNCLVQFRVSMEHQKLKRVTAHQNKQLFQIAQKLKKKNEAYEKLIGEKKAKTLMQRSNLRKALKQEGHNKEISLGDRIDQNNIPVTPEALQNEFFMLCDYIKALFNATASKTNLNPVVLDLKSLVSKDPTILSTDDAEAADATCVDDSTPAAALSDLTRKILKTALTSKAETGLATFIPDADDQGEEASLNAYFEIAISRDKTKASIQKIKGMDFTGSVTSSSLLDFLRCQDITFGIIEDKAIEAWIAMETEEKELMVAMGEESVSGEDGHIKFHFENNYTNPGKIKGDGTIDFRDRGGIPYIHTGDLLAKKTPIKEGKNGMDVFGTPILVEEPLDPVFIAGTGTEASEDELEIYAALDGQPHVDAMGNITVNPELMIKGDVDFETGNIDFNGDIIVKGTIKEGFTIKGISLTAQEIEGAAIDLSGDLNISAGITEAKIISVGNIHAKFINDSSVKGFGDLIIQKEIIDSDIMISGACQNPAGHIISSKIIAKQGIEAGKIGTTGSKPAILKVGMDEHIKIMTQKIEDKLQKALAQLQELREKIKLLETQDQELYEQITQKAQIQDKAQNESKELKQTILDLKKVNDTAGIQKAFVQIKKLTETAEQAEQELN